MPFITWTDHTSYFTIIASFQYKSNRLYVVTSSQCVNGCGFLFFNGMGSKTDHDLLGLINHCAFLAAKTTERESTKQTYCQQQSFKF